MSHTIIVRATSADSSFATRSFIIAVNDLNEFGISAASDANATLNTRSERIRAVATELAQAAVFGGMIVDNGFSSTLVSLNFFTIDQLVQSINDPTISERQELAGKVAVGSAAFVTTSLSVGYVIWILRGDSLLTTFMSAMPAWQAFDPLPVLQSFHKAVDEDDDSLLSIATQKTVDGLKKLRRS